MASNLSGVYMIKCLTSGKVYIGSSVNIIKRWKTHQSRLNRGNHHSRYLQNSWNKYGPDTFEWSILEHVSIDGLTLEETKSTILEREQHYIDTFRAIILNIRPQAESNLGIKHTSETRTKISIAMQNQSDEISMRVTANNRIREISEETRAKLSAAGSGRKLSENHKAKLSAAGSGRKLSEEHRAKIAANNRVRKLSDKQKARLLAANLGRKCSEETKAKISAANRGRKPNHTSSSLMGSANTELRS